MTTQKKRPILGFIGKLLGKTLDVPVVRGTLKTVPIGSWFYEVRENIQHWREQKEGPAPHSWVSLITQAVGLAVILYAFFSHKIDMETLLKWLGVETPILESPLSLTDSLNVN